MLRVLVIEDEADIRQSILEVLTFEGFEAIAAENGPKGVQLALQFKPDLIICDVMMPGFDGFEVLRQLQQEPSTSIIPFMFLTALADRKYVRYGMQLGAAAYLTKPFTRDELMNTINTRLTKHAAKRREYEGVLPAEALHEPVPAPSSHSWPIGTIVKGYQIGNLIGEGGMGTVYQAYQPSIGREVAIKVLRQKYVNNTEFIRRFQTEAELIARLEHPHIIPLYDYWHDSEGVYIVMRWLRGGNLRDALRKSGPWQLPQVIHTLNQIAEALYVAHSVGIIHRDIKPDNILLDEWGNVYLTDFGMAKNLFSGETDTSVGHNLEALLKAQDAFFKQDLSTTLYITDDEQVPGTPAYLSPEQIRAEALLPQSDIYNLGETIYELLTGEQPFHGSVGEVLIQQLVENLPSVRQMRPELPSDIDDVLQKATAKDWHDRYENVRIFAEDFYRAQF